MKSDIQSSSCYLLSAAHRKAHDLDPCGAARPLFQPNFRRGGRAREHLNHIPSFFCLSLQSETLLHIGDAWSVIGLCHFISISILKRNHRFSVWRWWKPPRPDPWMTTRLINTTDLRSANVCCKGINGCGFVPSDLSRNLHLVFIPPSYLLLCGGIKCSLESFNLYLLSELSVAHNIKASHTLVSVCRLKRQ